MVMAKPIDRIKARGLTLTALAERAGVTTGYVSLLLSGERRNPSAVVIKKLVEASDGALTAADFIEAAQ